LSGTAGIFAPTGQRGRQKADMFAQRGSVGRRLIRVCALIIGRGAVVALGMLDKAVVGGCTVPV